jgi:hypothetical protein
LDARGIVRLLEKIQGLAESAEHVGTRNAETIARESRLSDAAKTRLVELHRAHAQRVMQAYALLGLDVCDALQSETDDDAARGQLELFRANLTRLRERAERLKESE